MQAGTVSSTPLRDRLVARGIVNPRTATPGRPQRTRAEAELGFMRRTAASRWYDNAVRIRAARDVLARIDRDGAITGYDLGRNEAIRG